MQDQLLDEIAAIYGGFLRLVDAGVSTEPQAASVVEFAPKVVAVLAMIYDLNGEAHSALLARIRDVGAVHRASRAEATNNARTAAGESVVH